jgi:hypothetical protein
LNPLYLLREFVTSGRIAEIKEEGDEIWFGDLLRIPSNTETIYKDNGDFVTLISALLVAKNKNRFQYVSEMGKVWQKNVLLLSFALDVQAHLF